MNSDSQILKTVKRSNMMLVTISMISLIIVGVLATISTVPYWIAQLGEPIEMSAEEILSLSGSEHLYNRAVSGLDMDDTYYYHETVDEDTGRQISIDAYFGALEIGKDKWILVRDPNEINTREEDYIGTLQPVSESVTREVYDLAADEMRIDFLPIMLDTTEDEIMWYVGTAILVIVALLSLLGVIAFLRRSSNPANHPILRKLARFGDVEDVIHAIDKDLTLAEDKVGKLYLTKNYLIHSGRNNFDAMPYHSVAWVYKMVIKGKYGTKTYQAHICDITGHEMKIAAKENDVNIMLQAVQSRAPHAIAGFSEDIKRAWNKDRQTLFAEVKKRRQQIKAQQ